MLGLMQPLAQSFHGIAIEDWDLFLEQDGTGVDFLGDQVDCRASALGATRKRLLDGVHPAGELGQE